MSQPGMLVLKFHDTRSVKFWAASIEDDGALLLSSSSRESSPVGIGKNGLVWKVVIGLPFVVGGMTRRREHGRAHTGRVAVLSRPARIARVPDVTRRGERR